MGERTVPPDFDRCQTERPSTWPNMPSFMTLGPVSYRRCENEPTWIAADGEGSMTLCDECKGICERAMQRTPATAVTFRRLEAKDD